MDNERENKKPAYLILSIDGGGFRALACLRILAHLMTVVSDRNDDDTVPPPRPCQIFDLICGTSAGGLIAILLGRFGLSCEKAIEVYRELSATMFGDDADSTEIWTRIMEGGRLSLTAFERKLEDLTENYTGSKDALFMPAKSTPDTVVHESTKIFVTVMSKIGGAGVDAYRVRSYARPLYEIDPAPYGHKWTVCEGARGTCAIPLYLSPLEIRSGHATFRFQDAGYSGFNNPAKVAIGEAEQLFGTDAAFNLISLGTGLRSLIEERRDGVEVGARVKAEDIHSFAQRILENVGEVGRNVQNAPEVATRIAKQLLEVATDTEISHSHVYEQIKRRPVRSGKGNSYHRFNPPQGLGDIEMTDYRKETEIMTVTDAWLSSPAGRKAVSSAVESLKDHPRVKQAIQGQHDLGASGTRNSEATRLQSIPQVNIPLIAKHLSNEHQDTGENVAESGELEKDQDGRQTLSRGHWSALVHRLNCCSRHIGPEVDL